MVVIVLEGGKARMFTKENYINANDRLTGGRGPAVTPGDVGKLNLGITNYLSTL
jgi:hypothetical protein